MLKAAVWRTKLLASDLNYNDFFVVVGISTTLEIELVGASL